MADETQMALFDMTEVSEPPDPPSEAGVVVTYAYQKRLWNVSSDGTRYDLAGLSSSTGSIPVTVTTTYTVLANTQIVAKLLFSAAGATILVADGGYLFV